jgi:hypothetical protein
MKYLFRTLCVSVFLVGLLALSQAQNSNNTQNDIEPAQSYVVTSVQYFISPDGSAKIVSRRTRYVKANGEWRLELYGPKGKDASSKNSEETPVYAGGSDGVSARPAGSNLRRYVSPEADQQMLDFFRSHKSLRNHREFVRNDEVAGLLVYVLRAEFNDPANPQEWQEESYSPKTGFTPLRKIIHFRDGSEIRIEAVSVEFKEVPENLNDDMKALPMKQEDKSSERKKNLQ